MNIRETIVADAKAKISNGWVSEVSPGCANLVSNVYKSANVDLSKLSNPNWVPSWVEASKPVTKPQIGDLIVFDRTYDAVAPGGVGPEDDMTHIGIYIGSNVKGKDMFIHYSRGAARTAFVSDWSSYNPRYYQFITEEKFSKAKIFVNDGKAVLILNGKTFPLKFLSQEIVFEE